MYNLTAITQNTTGMASLITGVNDNLMGGLFGIGLLIALATICFMAFYTNTGDLKSAMAATGFIALTISIFFRALGWVSNEVLFISLASCSLAIAISWKTG